MRVRAMKPQTDNTAENGQPQGAPSRPTHGQTGAIRPEPSPVQPGAGSPAALAELTEAAQAHVERIRAARRRTEQLLEAAFPGYTAVDASVSVAWEKVFDYLCDNPNLDEPELTKISGVIQKLSGAFNQIKGLELKLREEERRQAERDAHSRPPEDRALAPETLARIERELNLL